MKKQFFFHIGSPKTATTFLQRQYFPHMKNVMFLGKDVTSSTDYLKYIGNIPKLNNSALKYLNKDIDCYIEDICKIKNVKKPVTKKYIVSDESFFSTSHNMLEIGNTLLNIKEVFGKETKIILTIRRQDNFLESMYRQYIRGGHFSSINHFLNYSNGSFGSYYNDAKINIDVKTLSWLDMYRTICSFFKKENILLLPFEEFVIEPKVFCSKLDSFIGEDGCTPDFSKKSNKRDSFLAMKALRVLNRFTNNQRNGFPILIQNPLIPFLPPHSPNENKILNKIRNFSYSMTCANLVKIFNNLDSKDNSFISPKIKKEILSLHSGTNKELDISLNLGLKKHGYY